MSNPFPIPNMSETDDIRVDRGGLITLHMSRCLHILQALMVDGERISREGHMGTFIRCVEFELIITSWLIACYITSWGWKDLCLPPAFGLIVQATATGLLEDELVVEALAYNLGTSLPPTPSDPPRAWWVDFPSRQSEAPKSQDDMEDLDRLYPADNTQLTILLNAIAAGCTPPCPALLSASTGWTPLAEDVRDSITSADSLLLTVFRNGIPDGLLDFDVGYRWWEGPVPPMTASQRYYLTFRAWWNEQPNSITRGSLRLKTTAELRAAIDTLVEERDQVDEDIAKALVRVVGLRIQLKRS
ncbi:hypothetical protein CC1G_14492 [Coprinopsis cinerea okayama7|uniref:Uncharacterized protein n=1 Tax=Coprinopsis cinerea (strain Okayama-7 / 130 / ATCC MYA-4618 / FGSC 9003) TaxID=240176 RepID=D6RLV2_COPC7|nr:hypothetical protein CC1G_14492 [Coprinopsis cinerea okayama7\|eukprot:XP_002911494.1 hypothetical protein CC1G_14492 [Coprinopsis cinerea okayama7\